MGRYINFILLLFILLLSIASITSCKQDEKKGSNYDLIISNVNLIDGTGSDIKTSVNVYIKDSVISRIDTNEIKAGDEVTIINGKGKYLIPGLFDCHVHTASEPSYIAKFIHFGVTSIFITGGSRSTNTFYKKMRGLGNQDSIPAPRVFHTSQHFIVEGSHPVKTYTSSNWKEGESFFLLKDTAQISELVKRVSKYPITGIKLTIEDGPHPPMVERMPQEFIDQVQKEAEKNDLEVFAHISDNIELKMAVKANIKNLLHFTGVDLDFVRDSTLVSKIYRDSINWVTTLMLDKSFLYPLHPEWAEDPNIKNLYPSETFEAINDSSYVFRANDYIAFMKDYLNTDTLTLKDAVQFQVDDIKVLIQNGVNMALGTDTGNTFILQGYSLHEEMQLLELGGLSPATILKMGTLNAAKMMKAEDRLGSIEVGKLADMILLDENPLETITNTLKINSVFKNGRIQTRME